MKSIVMLQAWFRGTNTRKRLAYHLKMMSGHQGYMSSGKSKSNSNLKLVGDKYENQTLDDSGLQIEEKSEVVFKNGAVYKG